MRFLPTPLGGVFIIESEPARDERGSFERTFDAALFRDKGLFDRFAQHSVSINARRGTLRGMHFQKGEHGETKLVRCTAGRAFDVVVDLRPDSPTRGKAFSLELAAGSGRSLYVPRGLAHGFQSLEDQTAILYMIDRPYVAEAAGGIAWDDPDLAIAWPIRPPVALSERDRALPRLREVVSWQPI